jgi:para-nitrobenzyl esterase
VQQLLEAQNAVTEGADSAGYLAFRPVVDGVNLLEPPGQAIAAGSARQVPLLIGTNADEMTLFLAFDPAIAHLTEEQLQGRVARLIGPDAAADLSAGYRQTRRDADEARRLSAIMTDLVFRIPAVRVAEAQAGQHAPVWMYRFDWPSPLAGGRLGSTHGLDIPFVWDVLDRRGVALFTGRRRGRHALAKAMHAAWLAFARSGDPSTPLLPPWPGYELSRRATMRLDDRCEVIEDPRGDERQLWTGRA